MQHKSFLLEVGIAIPLDGEGEKRLGPGLGQAGAEPSRAEKDLAVGGPCVWGAFNSI